MRQILRGAGVVGWIREAQGCRTIGLDWEVRRIDLRESSLLHRGLCATS